MVNGLHGASAVRVVEVALRQEADSAIILIQKELEEVAQDLVEQLRRCPVNSSDVQVILQSIKANKCVLCSVYDSKYFLTIRWWHHSR